MDDALTTGHRDIGKIIGIGLVIAIAAAVVAFGMPPEQTDEGNELIILSQSPPDYLDTAMSYQLVAWQIFINANNGLLTYRKAGGTDGAELRPDLAESLPVISPDGTSYFLRVRRGIKYSPPHGGEVKPSDFKWAIERLLTMNSPGSGFFAGIEGTEAFTSGTADSISGIVADDDAYTIQFKLTAADPTFRYILAMPFTFAVPSDVPAADLKPGEFLPATGPYMFTEYTLGRRIRLERNPNFTPWSEDTPAGNVDSIYIELGGNPENAITRIKQGKADYLFDPIPKSKLVEILGDDKLREQLHVIPSASLKYIWMNVDVPPFDNVKVRQAINWAIDRRAMVKLSNGTGQPTENVLPPIMPGYVKHDIYPEQDMARAKELIAESGVTPGRINFWCSLTEPDPTVAQYMQDVLNELGFDAEVRCIDRSVYFTTIGNAKTAAPIGFGNWGQDFPEGSNFIDVLLNGERITAEHNNNYANYRGSDDLIAKANATLDQESRNEQWAAIDRKAIEDAAWAPYMAPDDYKFVSERLQGYVPSPVYGMLFSMVTVDGTTPPEVPGTSHGGGPAEADAEAEEGSE